MKKITDEMLNDYIDNQLDNDAVRELNDALTHDSEAINKLKALKLVDQTLGEIPTVEAPMNFTSKMMNIIAGSSSVVKQKSYFFYSVIGFFSAAIIAILGYSFATMDNSDKGKPAEITSYIDKIKDSVLQHANGWDSFFTNQNIIFIGIFLSVILLVSAFFVAESHKSFKEKLNSFQH